MEAVVSGGLLLLLPTGCCSHDVVAFACGAFRCRGGSSASATATSCRDLERIASIAVTIAGVSIPFALLVIIVGVGLLHPQHFELGVTLEGGLILSIGIVINMISCLGGSPPCLALGLLRGVLALR